jgi:CheY-like chemotaxis protein
MGPNGANGHDRTVLIVEDEPDIQFALKHVLEQAGYRVVACGNGDEALDIMRTTPPALVILDLILSGGMNGLRFCHVLKHDEALAAIPVVIVSAAIDPGNFTTCAAAAAFRKPLDIPKLVAKVGEIVPAA